jgi:hypothetical protein
MDWDLDISYAVWRKSSLSTNDGACVEVAVVNGASRSMNRQRRVVVRDSKNPTGRNLIFTPEVWDSFLAGVRHGRFDFS